MTDNMIHQLEATKALHSAIAALFIEEVVKNQLLAGLASTYAMIGRGAWPLAFTTDFNEVERIILLNRKLYSTTALAVERLKIAEQQYIVAIS